MTNALLDTDILSEISKGRDAIVLQNAAAYLRVHRLFTLTSISVYEVLAGMHAKPAPRQVEKFMDLISDHEELIPGSNDYRLAAEIRGALRRIGRPIDTGDTIIAACAIRLNLPLVTGNTRHYSYVQSAGFALQLLNWREI